MSKKIGWICGVIVFIIVLFLVNSIVNENSYQPANTNNENIADITPEATNKNHDESIVAGKVIQVTQSDFEETVLNSGKTVLVDFYADWCGPCRALSPIIDEVAEENTNENLIFVRINIDDEEQLANKYGVQYIPTLLLIRDGEELNTSVGYIDKEELLNFISSESN